MSSLFGSQKETLLKKYIDARFLVIRLEKLRSVGSNRALNASEAVELEECVSQYNKFQKGVESVSEKENTTLNALVYSLLRCVSRKNDDFKQNAILAAENEKMAETSKNWDIDRLKKARDTLVEKARKAEANPEPDNIPAGDEWVRYWNAEKNGEYFQDPVSKETAWVLPEGKSFRHGHALSRENPRSVPTTARFQSINPYLVS